MEICFQCKQEGRDLIATDQCGQSEIHLFCEDCFYKLAKIAFHLPNMVCKCGEKLVLKDDKHTVLALAHDGDELTYRCQYVEDARILSRYECVIELDRLHDKQTLKLIQS